MATKGAGSPEVEQTYARARELCEHEEETPRLFPVLHGLWRFYNNRAAYQTARELGEQLFALAQRDDNPVRLSQAHHALGFTLCYLGEMIAAYAHLEQGTTLADPTQERAAALRSGIATSARPHLI